MKNAIISVKNISKQFNKNESYIFDHLSFDIYQGDFTIIMGKSGAGKSTLLYSISGMDHVTDGKIIYDKKDISKLNEKEISKLRTEDFGFIFQQSHLVSYLTLLENTLIAGYQTKRSKKEVDQKAHQLFKQMNVEHIQNHLPSEISGGEAQRGAIARALINEPKMIFADEPTGALNKANSEQVLDLMSQMNKNGQSILMVTHDIRAALRGNRILYLEDGKIIGEMTLEPYMSKNAQEREKNIQAWLSSMEW